MVVIKVERIMLSRHGRNLNLKTKTSGSGNNYSGYSDMVRRENAILDYRRAEKRKLMLESEYPHVMEISIPRVSCPLNILNFTKALKEIKVGETLEIKVGSESVTNDLLAACRLLGQQVKVVENQSNCYLYVTKTS